MKDADAWLRTPRGVCLDRGFVDVWRFPLQASTRWIDLYRSLLTDGERERAGRLRIPARQAQFIIGRAVMRATLARLLGLHPKQLPITYNPHGKPRLDGNTSGQSAAFNLSHSGRWGLLAVTTGRRVGVDIQEMDPRTECEKLAERFFSRRESAALMALPWNEQRTAFFRGWTRKEAFLKAMGRGISMGLDTFDVSLGPEDPPAVLATRFEPDEGGSWMLNDLNVAEGYAAALAADGPPYEVRRWRMTLNESLTPF